MNANQSAANSTSTFKPKTSNIEHFIWISSLAVVILFLLVLYIILCIKKHRKKHKRPIQRQNAINRKHIDYKSPLDADWQTNLTNEH